MLEVWNSLFIFSPGTIIECVKLEESAKFFYIQGWSPRNRIDLPLGTRLMVYEYFHRI